MSHGVTYRTVWGRNQDITLGLPQEVIFHRPTDVGRGSPQNVEVDVPWRYIEDHMGTSMGRLLGTSSGRHWDLILPSGLFQSLA